MNASSPEPGPSRRPRTTGATPIRERAPAAGLESPDSPAQVVVFGVLASGVAFVVTAGLVLVLGWRPCGPGLPDSAPLLAGGLAALLVGARVVRSHLDRRGAAPPRRSR